MDKESPTLLPAGESPVGNTEQGGVRLDDKPPGENLAQLLSKGVTLDERQV